MSQELQTAKKHRASIWLWVSFVLLVGVCLVTLFPLISKSRSAPVGRVALAQLKQIGMAHLMYSGDFDDRLAPCEGWSETLAIYIRNPDLLIDPTSEPRGKFGFAMNEALSGAYLTALSEKNFRPLHFSTNISGSSVRGGAEALRITSDGKTNVAFADGSARAIRVANLKQLDWSAPKEEGPIK